MALEDRQTRLVVAAILPVLLSTIVVCIRATRKVKRRPTFISKIGALTAEILIVASVVSMTIATVTSRRLSRTCRSLAGSLEPSCSFRFVMDSGAIPTRLWRSLTGKRYW